MKKTIAMLVLLALVLTGCGRRQDSAGTAGHYSVIRNDIEILLNAPAEPILSALGAPCGYAESRSSAYRGVEKTYRFHGIHVRTYPSSDGERILGVQITDSSVKTPEGVAVGDTAAAVRRCYGEDAIRNDCCIISHNREQMVLTLKNNVVTSIQYLLL